MMGVKVWPFVMFVIVTCKCIFCPDAAIPANRAAVTRPNINLRFMGMLLFSDIEPKHLRAGLACIVACCVTDPPSLSEFPFGGRPGHETDIICREAIGNRSTNNERG